MKKLKIFGQEKTLFMSELKKIGFQLMRIDIDYYLVQYYKELLPEDLEIINLVKSDFDADYENYEERW